MSNFIYCPIFLTDNQQKWFNHYKKLILRGLTRSTDKEEAKTIFGYIESHHIIPHCMNGSDVKENIVFLTPEEHFVAHQLLLKIYPSCNGLATACIIMCTDKNGKRINNKKFGWIKRKFSLERSEMMSGENHPMFGKQHSKETKLKISITLSGRKLPQEQIEKTRKSNTGKKRSDVSKKRMSDAQIGKILSIEHRRKLGDSKRGKSLSLEHKKKISENHPDFSGENHPMFGRHHSEEAKLKISIGNTGKIHTDETKLQMSKSKIGISISEQHKNNISNSLKKYSDEIYQYIVKQHDLGITFKQIYKDLIDNDINISYSSLSRIYRQHKFDNIVIVPTLIPSVLRQTC